MRMNLYLASAIASIIILAITLLSLYTSANWLSTEGIILKADIKENYNRPGTSQSENRHSFEYMVDLEYEYSINGKKYYGSNIYPGLPNIFPDRHSAKEMLEKYSTGSNVDVYFDPQQPGNSSLITSKNIPTKSLVILVSMVTIIAALVVGGIVLFNKYF